MYRFVRFLGKDIITIREAAWLTDNTYNYEEVVRMMGEITATLTGNFRVRPGGIVLCPVINFINTGYIRSCFG